MLDISAKTFEIWVFGFQSSCPNAGKNRKSLPLSEVRLCSTFLFCFVFAQMSLNCIWQMKIQRQLWQVFKDSVYISQPSSIMYLVLLKKTFGVQFGWPQNVYCFVCCVC